MKKTIALLLIMVLALGLTLTVTGCASEPYSNYDLTEYITLPDYNSYKVDEPDVKVTDADVDEEIKEILKNAAKTDTVKKGTVEKGDTITIAYDGVLADGTKSDGMSTEGTDITLGSAGYIDGFEEGLYGAKIGSTVKLDLKFPDPYTNNPDLSGKDVTFTVTIISKNVSIEPEFNDAFVKENSEFKNTSEYKNSLKKDLEKEEYDEQLHEIKGELYSKIVENTTVIKYPDKEIKEQIKILNKTYQDYAESYGYEWEDFITEQLKTDEEGYDKMVKLYAQEVVKQEMVIYLVAQNEELDVTDEEYNTYLDSMLTSSGFESEKDFKDYTGMSLKKYAKENKLDRDLLLTKVLDVIYERLADKN